MIGRIFLSFFMPSCYRTAYGRGFYYILLLVPVLPRIKARLTLIKWSNNINTQEIAPQNTGQNTHTKKSGVGAPNKIQNTQKGDERDTHKTWHKIRGIKEKGRHTSTTLALFLCASWVDPAPSLSAQRADPALSFPLSAQRLDPHTSYLCGVRWYRQLFLSILAVSWPYFPVYKHTQIQPQNHRNSNHRL